MAPIARQIVIEKSAVITFENEVDEMAFRRYMKDHWKKLTLGLNDSTILFLAGVHGSDSGKLGPNENIQTLKNQFKPEILQADWLLEDKVKRSIKIEFLNVPDFFLINLDEETKEIDEGALVSEIQLINPKVVIMMICYSHFLDLKSLLERVGLFPTLRINQDLNILSNGQILTMNDVQKEFIQNMTLEDHVEKDVIVTGPVGSGKTLLGLEAINIKKSHYKKKYGISSSDCKNKLRFIIWIGSKEGNTLKQQLEMSDSNKDCTVDINTELNPDSEKLTRIFQANENYKFYSHTLIMLDEIKRYHICKINLDENQKVDYIYCLQYSDSKAVQPNSQPLEVTDTTISCNLDQRQRSSQQILDLADYLQMHYSYPIRRWNSGKSFLSDIPLSFSSDIPLWFELSNPKVFFDYFKDKFESDDVMLIWDKSNKPSNINDIEEFCKAQKWRCTSNVDVRGSEASVTILYDLYSFRYESLTRAKTQLVIITIDGSQSDLSTNLQDIEIGNHDDEKCGSYWRRYKDIFGPKLAYCQFKRETSKIQSLIRKIHITTHPVDGSVTEAQSYGPYGSAPDIGHNALTENFVFEGLVRKIGIKTRFWDGRKIVQGFKVTLVDGRNKAFGMSLIDDLNVEDEFEVPEGQYIQSVILRSGWYIDTFGVVTNAGLRFEVGGSGGDERQRIGQGKNTVLVGISGNVVRSQYEPCICRVNFKFCTNKYLIISVTEVQFGNLANEESETE